MRLFERWSKESQARKNSRSRQSKLSLESLEHRQMLTTIELADLASGDGSDGFVVSHDRSIGAAGLAVEAAGDINADGYTDFLVGDPGFNTVEQRVKIRGRFYEKYEGAVFVVYGTSSGMPNELDLLALDGTNGFTIQGNPDDAELAGRNISGAGGLIASGGDINGDGIDDLAIVSPNRGGDFTGRAYVIYGIA